MKKRKLFFGITVLLFSTLFSGCDNNNPDPTTYEEKVVVANRGSSNISFVDANSNAVTTVVPLPSSEPMYVVYVPAKDKLYVGDRAGNKVSIVNPDTKAIENSISVGKGVFHMWADGQGKQLWVVNDTDKTISVIDLASNTVIQTINVDLKPHDVFVTKDGTKAFVSVFESDITKPDKVYSYSTSTFTKTGEASVGKDPHLYHLSSSNKLFVPCQSGQVYVLNGTDLTVSANNPYPGAHGINASPDQSNVFVTNIVGAQLYSINASTNVQNGNPLTTLSLGPHNIAINEGGNKMFVTNSGAIANTLSTYTVNGSTLAAGNNITVGTNPFGLAYYRRVVKN